jgi:hypothetical protein
VPGGLNLTPWQLLRSYVISKGKLAYGFMSWFKALNYFLIRIEAKLVPLLHLLTYSHGMGCGPCEQGLNQVKGPMKF